VGKKSSKNLIATSEQIQKMVHVVRGQRVMLDFDLARLYGVTTAALNQQVSRNRDRFPEDFAYQLTQKEFTSLMSQIAISKTGRGGRRKPPWVFTEHGVAMLIAEVLNRLMANPEPTKRRIGFHVQDAGAEEQS
jgi:hypothetical protein